MAHPHSAGWCSSDRHRLIINLLFHCCPLGFFSSLYFFYIFFLKFYHVRAEWVSHCLLQYCSFFLQTLCLNFIFLLFLLCLFFIYLLIYFLNFLFFSFFFFFLFIYLFIFYSVSPHFFPALFFSSWAFSHLRMHSCNVYR